MAFVRSLLFINAVVCICLYFLKKHRLIKGLLQTPQNVIFYDYFLFFRCLMSLICFLRTKEEVKIQLFVGLNFIFIP